MLPLITHPKKQKDNTFYFLHLLYLMQFININKLKVISSLNRYLDEEIN